MTDSERDDGAPFVFEIDRPVVVVAEDNHEMRRVLRSRLTNAGYRVREARNAFEALSRIRAGRALGRGSTVAVLVADIRMPGMDGLELLARVRALDPTLPVILVTAFGDPETHAEAMRRGAAASLDKPLGPAQLLEELRRVAPVSARARADSR